MIKQNKIHTTDSGDISFELSMRALYKKLLYQKPVYIGCHV